MESHSVDTQAVVFKGIDEGRARLERAQTRIGRRIEEEAERHGDPLAMGGEC